MSLVRLRSDHASLVGLAAHFNLLMNERGAIAVDEIVDIRASITQALLGHLAAEDLVLYPRLLASGDRAAAATAQCFIDEMGGLSAVYKAYIAEWPRAAAAADWNGFRRASQKVFALLAKRVEREETELYPLAEREGLDERQARFA